MTENRNRTVVDLILGLGLPTGDSSCCGFPTTHVSHGESPAKGGCCSPTKCCG